MIDGEGLVPPVVYAVLVLTVLVLGGTVCMYVCVCVVFCSCAPVGAGSPVDVTLLANYNPHMPDPSIFDIPSACIKSNLRRMVGCVCHCVALCASVCVLVWCECVSV